MSCDTGDVTPTIAMDTSLALGWFKREDSAHTVLTGLLAAGGARLVLPAPAVTEFISGLRADGATPPADQLLGILTATGITIEQVNDVAVYERAGDLYATPKRDPRYKPRDRRPHTLSTIDSQILALCESRGWPVLTGDVTWQHVREAGHTTADVRLFDR